MDVARMISTLCRRFGLGRLVADFATTDSDALIGELVRSSAFSVDQSQVGAWAESIRCLVRRWQKSSVGASHGR